MADTYIDMDMADTICRKENNSSSTQPNRLHLWPEAWEEFLPFKRDLLPRFLPFFALTFSLFPCRSAVEVGKGLGMQLGPKYSAQVSQQVKAQMRGAGEGEHGDTLPCHHGTWHRGRVA